MLKEEIKHQRVVWFKTLGSDKHNIINMLWIRINIANRSTKRPKRTMLGEVKQDHQSIKQPKHPLKGIRTCYPQSGNLIGSLAGLGENCRRNQNQLQKQTNLHICIDINTK